MMSRHASVLCVAFGLASTVGVACGGAASSAAPPKVEEAPIDTESSRREAKRPPPGEGEEISLERPPGDDRDNGGGRGGDSSAGHKPGLTRGQCDDMINHYIELVVAGPNGPLKGTTGKELDNARSAIKMMVQTDANMQGLQQECVTSGTRRKHACALNAATTEEWQRCIQ